MRDQNLPLQPDPTPEERAQLDQLSAALDAWAADAAERIEVPATPAAAPERRDPARPGRPARLHRGHIAAGLLAASVAGFLLLPDPGIDPVEGPAPAPVVTGSALRAADLEVASPHPYMIVPTRDPSISIVWILDTDTNEGD